MSTFSSESGLYQDQPGSEGGQVKIPPATWLGLPGYGQNQQWLDQHKSHSRDIIVHWSDGHITHGIRKDIEALKYMFTFVPDNRITVHPVRFGTSDGQWTAVIGSLDGTFTQPMVMVDGKVIQPTGMACHIPMAAIGHWNKQGVMDEEYLFWDNALFMKEIGLAQ